ncbi:MAG: CHAT domain-containing protein, partial [Planctomycetes bacterium]|nr:CHAT domain-containing protein [Planctomycetota bacterium]
VSSISNLFKDEMTFNMFLREDANEDMFKKMATEAKYLHIATHGILSEENPAFSGLVLSTNPESKEDGFCYLIEIYNMKLKADLVVLSACQTGLGKIIKGEGIEGLSRAFMYAGAKRMVVSLWSVDDASTADFMNDFYNSHIKTGESIASALALAKKSMISSRKYSAPYFWSPFVFIGDYKKIPH